MRQDETLFPDGVYFGFSNPFSAVFDFLNLLASWRLLPAAYYVHV